MKISILMNCYNADKTLEEAVDSVLAQTCPDWELVVVENHSTDRSAGIIADYADRDSRIRVCPTPVHMPLGEAREFGIILCDGDYVCFLDTDDVWMPDKLEKQLALLQEKEEIDIVYSGCYVINERSQIKKAKRYRYEEGDLFGKNLATYQVNFQTVIFRRSVLARIDRPFFDPKLMFSPDYNLIMRILSVCKACCMDELLVKYRITAGSLTRKSVHLWGKESKYTFDQLSAKGTIEKATVAQQKSALAKIDYYNAVYAMSLGKCQKAHLLLRKHIWLDWRYALLYVASYFSGLWDILHRLK